MAQYYSYAPPQDPTLNPAAPQLIDMFDMGGMPSNFMSGLNAYRSQALRTGPSAWASLSKVSNAANEASQKEMAQKKAASATATAQDQLASSGGLSSGARERSAEEGAKNYLSMDQDLTRQGNLNDLQIGVNDETNRMQQLGALPGMENQALSTIASKNKAQNDFNMGLYHEAKSGWAAKQQADATANAGKK